MDTYTVLMSGVAVSAAKTLVQVNGAATSSLRIKRAWIGQVSTTTSELWQVRLNYRSTAGTGSAATPVATSALAPAFGGTAAVNFTAEPTIGNIAWAEIMDIAVGWQWYPRDADEEIVVAPSGRFGLDITTTPGGARTVTAGIMYQVIG